VRVSHLIFGTLVSVGAIGSLGSGGLAGITPAGSAAGVANSSAAPPVNQVQQIACWLYEGGWPPALIPTADAITFPESGGNPQQIQHPHTVVDVGRPGVGVGLLQITPGTMADLDPIQNARDGWGKYQRQSWGAWTTYTGGQYLAYVGRVDAALAGFNYAAGCGGAA
jgi:hypothetical protein